MERLCLSFVTFSFCLLQRLTGNQWSKRFVRIHDPLR